MARVVRIQFPGAIYHVMARGNARQKIFRDERDYGRFVGRLEATFEKFRFEISSFVCMPIHLVASTRSLPIVDSSQQGSTRRRRIRCSTR